MASEFPPAVTEINGINLANYFPNKRSCNSVVYIHKKFLNNQKDRRKENTAKANNKQAKVKCADKKTRQKCDKAQQCEILNFISEEKGEPITSNSLLEHTIRFAKNVVPLIIPPAKIGSPTPEVYTIKTAKKSKKKPKLCESSFVEQDDIHERKKPKKVVETFRKEKVKCYEESYSIKESVSHSSQNNTLEELNINNSLSYTLSEISEKRFHKKERGKNVNKTNMQRVIASESFEALATELMSSTGDTKIKIHLMNETDKNIFSESIKIPVLNAIKDCLFELNNQNEINSELTTVQRFVKCNTQKLDNILDRLASVEQKLEAYSKDNRANKTPRVQTVKASKLEQLGEDIIEIEEKQMSEDESANEAYERHRIRRSAVVTLSPKRGKLEKMQATECGETQGDLKAASSSGGVLGVKPDRPNRMPARFCWTDAARNH